MPQAPTVERDRTYWEGLVDQYLDALVARAPWRLPLSENVRFTENGQVLEPGDGLWATADGLGVFRHHIADPQSGQAAFVGTVRENGAGVILLLRLKAEAGLVTEIESVVIRHSAGADKYDELGSPDPVWFTTIPPAERADRSGLSATANLYFAGLEQNDGSRIPPFHPDCNRTENATQTSNLQEEARYGHWDIGDFVNRDCAAQFGLGLMRFVTEIRSRRFPVIDEERGVVVAFGVFDHDGTVHSVRLTDGRKLQCPTYFRTPRSLPIVELFKIENGLIRQVEANLTEGLYGMQTGWEENSHDEQS